MYNRRERHMAFQPISEYKGEFVLSCRQTLGKNVKIKLSKVINFINSKYGGGNWIIVIDIQLTLEHHEFELCGSTYMHILISKYVQYYKYTF